MSELAWRMMLARKWGVPQPGMTPKLGDLVRFTHPGFGTASGYVIMIIAETDRPTRCEVLVRHGNTGWATYHWRRADELNLLGTAKPNQRHPRYSVRHQDREDGGETA